jgi:hypothetical protein
MYTFVLGGERGRCGEPTTYAEFRWARGKITRGRLLTFNGAGNTPAGYFYVY